MASPLIPVFAFLGALAGSLLVAFLLGLVAFLAVAGGDVRPGKWYDPRSRQALERALRTDQALRRWAAAGAIVAFAAAIAQPFLHLPWVTAGAMVAGFAVLLWWLANHGLATGVDKAGGLP